MGFSRLWQSSCRPQLIGFLTGALATLMLITITPQSFTLQAQLITPQSNSKETSESSSSQVNMYEDNTLVRDALKKKIRILCWVVTSAKNLDLRAVHVKNTWGKRCDILLFASDKENKTFGTMPIETPEGYNNLPIKVNTALDYIARHYIDQADWFIKCDDDTYLIVENLRYFLSNENTTDPVCFGHRFVVGYNSGGPGYVMSKEALKRYGAGWRNKTDCNGKYHTDEDVMMGMCFHELGVRLGDTHDVMNRSRFHCFEPEQHIKGEYPSWYYRYDAYQAKHGMESMSDYPISFHYIKKDMMYNIEYFLYHAHLHGVIKGIQNLSKKSTLVASPSKTYLKNKRPLES